MTLPKGPWGTKKFRPSEQLMLLGEVAGEGGRIVGWVTPAPGVDAEELGRQFRALPALIEAARLASHMDPRMWKPHFNVDGGTLGGANPGEVSVAAIAALRVVDGEE